MSKIKYQNVSLSNRTLDKLRTNKKKLCRVLKQINGDPIKETITKVNIWIMIYKKYNEQDFLINLQNKVS